MKKAPQKRVAGVGTAVGAVMFFGSMLGLGCQPGSLPCEKEDWKAICAQTPGGDAGTSTGGVSGTGGGGAGMGGMSGTGGMMMGVGPATAVANCADYKTVGEMDKFFAMRCGETTTCHPSGAVFGDLKSADVYKRILMKESLTCSPTKLADASDYTKGLIWAKTQDMPKCPGTEKAAGVKMPSADPGKMPMALSDTEKACLESYLKAITGK